MTSHQHDHQGDDGAPYGHDLGLAHDLTTLMGRRRALKLIAGAGLVTLVGCGSSKGSSSSSTTTGATSTTGASTTSTTGASSTTGSTAASATTAASTTTTAAATDADVSSAIPEETAGPYPGDGSNGPNALAQSGIVRSDIRSSFGTSSTVATGVPFTMKLRIVKVGSGGALGGAAVYVWHCDAAGRYSMYSQGASDENYLRGVQATDASGNVTFTSIFPACYAGRWPHVHFEVYPSVSAATGGSDPIATSQLALPEDACNAVYATSGYSQSVRNLSQVSLARDNVFSDGAERETPTVTGDAASGYVATLVVPVSA
jgi:protocatechuate 3,4-dioxygenase beta subunit